MTHSAPSTAPIGDAMPPITTMRHERSESADEEVALGERHASTAPGEQRAAEPGDARRRARRRAASYEAAPTVYAAARVGVVAHGDRRATDARLGAAGSRRRTRRRARPGPPSSRCAATRGRCRTAFPAGTTPRREVAGQQRLAVEVLLRGDREHERADREQQAPHSERADTDRRTASPAVSERGDHDRDDGTASAGSRCTTPRIESRGHGSERRRDAARRIRRRPSGPRTAGPPSR